MEFASLSYRVIVGATSIQIRTNFNSQGKVQPWSGAGIARIHQPHRTTHGGDHTIPMTRDIARIVAVRRYLFCRIVEQVGGGMLRFVTAPVVPNMFVTALSVP